MVDDLPFVVLLAGVDTETALAEVAVRPFGGLAVPLIPLTVEPAGPGLGGEAAGLDFVSGTSSWRNSSIASVASGMTCGVGSSLI